MAVRGLLPTALNDRYINLHFRLIAARVFVFYVPGRETVPESCCDRKNRR